MLMPMGPTTRLASKMLFTTVMTATVHSSLIFFSNCRFPSFFHLDDPRYGHRQLGQSTSNDLSPFFTLLLPYCGSQMSLSINVTLLVNSLQLVSKNLRCAEDYFPKCARDVFQ